MKYLIWLILIVAFALLCRQLLNLSPTDTARIFAFSLASALIGLGTYAALRWALERNRR